MNTPPKRLRIAFVGKGGAGKSSIAGTFARLLARRGEPVLALDSDPLPGMPYALGVPVEDSPLPDDLVVEGPQSGPRWILRPGLDAQGVIDRYAVVGPDDVRYLQFGNARGHIASMQRSQFAWSQVVREVDPERWHIVGDLPGGTRQPMFGWAKYADTVVIVVEPTTKSLHAARRLLNLSEADWAPRRLLLVANKVIDASDVSRIEARLAEPVAHVVPLDRHVHSNDRIGRPPLDASDTNPFVMAVAALIDVAAELPDAHHHHPPTES